MIPDWNHDDGRRMPTRIDVLRWVMTLRITSYEPSADESQQLWIAAGRNYNIGTC